MQIGERLEAARIRASLDLATVEERTKIRQRYLRALEDEDWAALPSSAYAKGFLRTYSELLGLDAEEMVDEYRRQVEGADEPSMHPLGDRVIEGRARRPAPKRRGPLGILIAVGAVIVLGIVLLVALMSGDDPKPEPKDAGADAGAGASHAGADSGSGETVALAMRVHDPVEVCLVGAGGGALVDGQVLAPGDHERFVRRGFALRFPSGFEPAQLSLDIGGRHRTLPRVRGPVAFSIEPPARLRQLSRRPGRGCP